MKKQFVWGVLFLLSFNVVAQTSTDAARYKYLERFKASTAAYKSLIASDSKNALLYKYQIGDNYLKIGKPDSAKLYFTEIINSGEKNTALGYVGLGKLTYVANPTEGKANFAKALEITKQNDGLVLAEIAEIYTVSEPKDLATAKLYLEKALKLEPANTRYMILYGDVLRGQAAAQGVNGDVSNATTQYNKALNTDPNYMLPYVRLGRLYIGSQAYTEAEKKFLEGLTRDSLYGPLYKELSDLFYNRNRFQKGYDYYLKYMSLADTTNDILYKYSTYLVYLTKYKEALPVLEKLKKENYSNPALYRLLAYSYFENNNVESADASMKQFLASEQKGPLLSRDYEYQGKILYKQGKDSLGNQMLFKALELDSNRIDLYGAIADQYYVAKKYDQAAKYYQIKMSKSKSTSAQDYLSLGKSYYFQGDYVQADTAFSRLIALRPDVPLGYTWRARIQEKYDPTQEKGLAKPYYEKYIELASKDPVKYKNDLLNAYDYLASYYYFIVKDKVKAKECWNKMLEIDPTNKKAKEGLKL